MIKFEVNKKYWTRSACDHDCIFTMEVISRTEKTIKADVDGAVKTLRIKTDSRGEYVLPYGRYSMCPVIEATDIFA